MISEETKKQLQFAIII